MQANYFNPRASYTFIMTEAKLELAKAISFYTILGKAKTLIFIWPDSDRAKWMFLVPNRHTPLPPPRHEELKVFKIANMEDDLGDDFKLYPPRVEDLKGRTLRVTGIDCSPHVAVKTNEDGTKEWFGFEVQMLEALSQAANFKTSYRSTSDGVLWGEFNGTSFNGLLGDLQQGHTDIGIANLYVRSDSSLYVDFSEPFNYDAYCFLVPMPKPGVNWLILLEPMSSSVWYFL